MGDTSQVLPQQALLVEETGAHHGVGTLGLEAYRDGEVHIVSLELVGEEVALCERVEVGSEDGEKQPHFPGSYAGFSALVRDFLPGNGQTFHRDHSFGTRLMKLVILFFVSLLRHLLRTRMTSPLQQTRSSSWFARQKCQLRKLRNLYQSTPFLIM